MKSKKGVPLHPSSIVRLAVLWLFMPVLPYFSCSVVAQENADSVVNRLVEIGFENVRWTDHGLERIYAFENNVYVVQADGVKQALRILREMGASNDRFYKLILTDQDIPQVAVVREPGGEWDVTYELDDSWKAVKEVKAWNRSLHKMDVSLEPRLHFKNLIINQIYQYLFELNPTLETSLWPGGKVLAQLIVPVMNDGYRWPQNKVRPGILAVSQHFRFPQNVFADLTLGTFTQDVYGFDADFKMPLKDERFMLNARLGVVEYGRWLRFRFRHTGEMAYYWSAGGNFFWKPYNTTIKVRIEQYLKKELGVKVEMNRHFKYGVIGLYAQKANGALANGGFQFYINLPPYKKIVAPYSRFGLRGTGVKYIGSNELKYYKMPVVDGQSENLTKTNQFNPLFIKNLINDY